MREVRAVYFLEQFLSPCCDSSVLCGISHMGANQCGSLTGSATQSLDGKPSAPEPATLELSDRPICFSPCLFFYEDSHRKGQGHCVGLVSPIGHCENKVGRVPRSLS